MTSKGKNPPGPRQPSVATKNQGNAGAPDNSLKIVGQDSISKPEMVEVPEGKHIGEMSDAEVISIIMSDDIEEELILKALEEGRIRGIPELVDASVKPLNSDSYLVRIATIKLLAELGDRRIVSALLERLDDHDPLVRGHAAKALGKLGSRKALSYLRQRYVSESVPEVKSSIRKAVEQINGFPMREQ